MSLKLVSFLELRQTLNYLWRLFFYLFLFCLCPRCWIPCEPIACFLIGQNSANQLQLQKQWKRGRQLVFHHDQMDSEDEFDIQMKRQHLIAMNKENLNPNACMFQLEKSPLVAKLDKVLFNDSDFETVASKKHFELLVKDTSD